MHSRPPQGPLSEASEAGTEGMQFGVCFGIEKIQTSYLVKTQEQLS